MRGLPVGNVLSKVFGTLIIIAITLLLGFFLYVYSNNTFIENSTSSVLPINMQVRIFTNPSMGQGYATVFLQNNGNSQIKISSIAINNYTMGVNITLPPNSTYQNVFPTAFSLQPGIYYTVVFHGLYGNRSIIITQNVLAES